MAENWWDVDTSATIRVTCKVCGTVRDVITNTDATGGVKLLEVVGLCEKHGEGSGLGEGDDNE